MPPLTAFGPRAALGQGLRTGLARVPAEDWDRPSMTVTGRDPRPARIPPLSPEQAAGMVVWPGRRVLDQM